MVRAIMSSKRAAGFSLDAALEDPGFTPSASDIEPLLDLVLGSDASRPAEKAIARIDGAVVAAIARRFTAERREKAKRVLLRIATQRAQRGEGAEAASLLEIALRDPDPGTRATAARLATTLGDARLIDLAAAEGDARVRGALGEALGMQGDARALALLAEGDARGPRAERARLVAERAGLRAEPSRVRADVPLGTLDGSPSRVRFFSRSGLERVLMSELTELGVASDLAPTPGRVDGKTTRDFSALLRARTALAFGVCIDAVRAPKESDAVLVARALTGKRARRIFAALTEGPVRVRIAWADGGKRRKDTWRVAELLQGTDIVSDSRDAPWEAQVELAEGGVALTLVPALDDPRFAYRVADVPAASHPTIAAAIARIGGAKPDDVVWDPFVGSGLELCERAKLGPYAQLIGTDIDPRALERARENLTSLGAKSFDLVCADAREKDPGRVTLVLTNPPMGRRVARGEDLDGLMIDVVTRAAHALAPGGRLVILSPRAAETARTARTLGLELTSVHPVDMGGFFAELQRFDRPRTSKDDEGFRMPRR
jgi:23S rRNA G2445 N2-methylase RlmL